mmetsp:Transcript_30709/g.102224  ORF Transcript_30709/g.102224 Transcript_30709/m.102224 type:complete len:123 (+) Transcript_30709:723-1091(+)
MVRRDVFGLEVFPAGRLASADASDGQSKSVSVFVQVLNRSVSDDLDGCYNQCLCYQISVSNLKTGGGTKTKQGSFTNRAAKRKGWDHILDRSSITPESGWLRAGDDAMKFTFRVWWKDPAIP